MSCWKCVACGCAIAIDDVRLGYDFRRYIQGYMCPGCFPEARTVDEGNVPMKVRLFNPGSSRTVTGTARQFGVEIETCRSFGYRNITSVFSAKPDGSVHGLEFVSPPLRHDAGLLAVEEFCTQALRQEMTVDWSCGLHVHIEAGTISDAVVGAVLDAYWRSQEVWHQLVPAHRRNTTFCRRFDGNAIGRILTTHRIGTTDADYTNVRNSVASSLGGRYWWLNFDALNRHGTFEVRLHQGCLNPHKINAWILAHLRFIDAVAGMSPSGVNRALPVGTNSFDQVFEVIGNSRLKRYWKQRQEMYLTNNTQEDDVALSGESWVS